MLKAVFCCAFLLISLSSSLVNGLLGKQARIRFPQRESGQEHYEPNVIRRWKFHAEPDLCLEFKLQGIFLEDSPSCVNDYLDVFDGNSDQSPRKLHACGKPQRMPRPIRTTGNDLLVVFNSDDNEITGHGFEAVVTTVSCTDGQQMAPPMTLPDSGMGPVMPIPQSGGSAPTCGLPKVTPVESGLYRRQRREEANADSESLIDEARIVGGQVARPNSWPWQVSIRYQNVHICGGTVVSPRHILSAAHCFKTISTNPSDFEFWVGKHLKEEREPRTEQQVFAERITLHENYEKSGKHDSDLAVIRLRSPVRYTNYVQPACLPWDKSYQPKEGTACYVTGFGTTKKTGGEDELKQAAVPIVSNEKCKTMDTRIGRLLTKNMMCAGYEEGRHDSCQGDSGGPLVCKIGPVNNWVLSGVVSFGFGCAGKSSPGIYVRLTEYLPWLRRQITDLPQ